MKKLISIFLSIAMVFSLIAMTVSAEETVSDGLEFDSMGHKTAEQLSHPGEYEINLTVPGVFETETYNEIIVMVDASLSQEKNFGNLKSFLIDLAEQVLSDDGSMRLTLMGFGLGPRRAGSFYSVEQLETWLATATQEDLLQGRSATNCEVGFEYVNDYINGNDQLKKSVVLYTSDGAANLDETPLNWANWTDETVFDYFKTFTKADAIGYIVGTELEHIYAGNDPIPATTEMFPEEAAAVSVAALAYGAGSEQHKSALDDLSTAMNTDGEDYVTAVLQSIFSHNGMDWDQSYSASEVELAFQNYFRTYVGIDDDSYSSYMDLFYIIFGDTGSTKLTNRYARAAAASAALMANEKVLGLYHVGYSGASGTWMNPENGYFADYDASKLKYVYNTEFAGVTEDLNSMVNIIITTGYKDVTVTDPMSKWVTLDESTIRIVDNNTGEVVWDVNGWAEGVTPLTAETPITVTTNDDGHRQITWKIKDGWLLHTDRYSLRYTVNVNETVDGFVYGTEYPANDPTYVTYTDPNGEDQTAEIEVPNVKETEKQPDLVEGDTGIRIYKQTAGASNKPISDISFKIYAVGDMEVGFIPTAAEIAAIAVDENLVATVTTDFYGYAFAKLESGRYLIVEQENEKVKAPVAPFYVLVPMYDAELGEYLNVVDIYPKNELKPETPEIPEPEVPEQPESDTLGTFSIVKYDDLDHEKLLAGAQFQILRPAAEGETGTAYTYNGETLYLVPVVDAEGDAIILTTGENGVATSPELPLGLYFLAETVAPTGYRLLEDVVAVYATVSGNETDPVGIANIAGTNLPETGGIGTTLFYILGSVLILGAVVLLVTKKRMGAAN